MLEDMLVGLFRSDLLAFHRRLGVLRCFRPDNPTGALHTRNSNAAWHLLTASAWRATVLASSAQLQARAHRTRNRPET